MYLLDINAIIFQPAKLQKYSIIQFSLFAMIFYKYLLSQESDEEFANDKEAFMKWGNDSVCNVAV